MKCLIPVHQELYPKNAVKRCDELCDEIEILYIVDEAILKKVREESAYVLPTYALEEMEKFVIEMQKKEAQRIKEKIPNSTLYFVVGEYWKSLEECVIKHNPDLLISDFFNMRFLNYEVPVWIDNGEKVKRLRFVIGDASRINILNSQIAFVKNISQKLGVETCLYPLYEELEEVLKNMGEICDGEFEILAVQRKFASKYKNTHSNLLIV